MTLERFVEEERYLYRIRTDDYQEGWVSVRFIELRWFADYDMVVK